MTWLDAVVLAATAVSIFFGAWRGLVREVVAVAGWIVAFVAANVFAESLSGVLPAAVNGAELRFMIAFGLIFLATLAVTTLAAMLLARQIKAAGLGALDRALGSFFGLVRGVVMVLAFGLLAGLTAVPRLSAWRDSVSGEAIARTVLALRPWLPRDLGDRLRYD